MASDSDPENQSLAEIADYHNDAVDSLRFFLRSRRELNDPRFVGSTPGAFDTFLSERIRETELRSTLTILAAIEAALHIDYQRRVEWRLKDPLSKSFRKLNRVRKTRPRFDDDLLELWKQHHPDQKSLISELRAALHFRHWLAHGRYWERPRSGRFDYFSVYGLAELVLASLPLTV